MAITYNRNEIVFGDQTGRKQTILTIPAEAATDKPGIVAFQSVADGGVRTNYYTWFDSNGVYRYHTSIPTNQDSDGSTITAGANTALSNLASVAINTALLPVTTVGAIDVGSATKAFRTAYLGTSLVFVGASLNTTLAFTEVGTLGRTYTFPDAGAAANVMLDTGAANVIAYTKGTSTIAMAANSDISMATGITATFNAACTIGAGAALVTSTEAITLNQSLSTTDDVTFGAINATTLTTTGAITDGTMTINGTGAISGVTTLAMGGALSGVTTAALSGALTCQGIVNTVAVIDSTVAIQIGADNVNLTLGVDDATDSRMYFNGTHLCFQDAVGGPYTLQQLATGTTLNPTVVGDLTIQTGQFIWTDAAAEAAGVWTFAGTSTIDIAVGSAITTGTVLSLTADSCANGKLLVLDADGDVGATGYYIYALDGTNPMFTVGVDGTVNVAGTAIATAALTVALGDVVASAGRLLVTMTGDNTSKIVRNVTTLTSAVLEVENTHISGGVCLLLDQKATGDLNALEITNVGTGYSVTTTGGVAGTGGFEYIAAASGTGKGLFLDGTTNSYVGADNTGFAEITSDGVLLAGANLLRVTSSGLNAAGSFLVEIEQTGKVVAATDGICLKISETAAATATSYAVCIASTSNEALHVDTGVSLFDETVSVITSDSSGGALIVTNPDTTANSNAVTINPSGSGAGLYIAPVEIDTVGIKILAVASTVPMINVDGATGGAAWVGAATTGMVQLSSDGALAADASLLRIASSGQPAGANDGACLEILESGAAQATSYAVKIDSTSNEALHVATGKALFDECATFTTGLRTQVAVTDVADPPTQANMVTAFGAAATAGAGFIGFLNDANGGVNTYLCVSSGTSWYYVAKMTVGA